MEITETFYRTENYSVNHSTFGGIINFSDFCTDHNRSEKSKSWAERIVSDWKFDEDCKKNAESRDKKKNYKKGVK